MWFRKSARAGAGRRPSPDASRPFSRAGRPVFEALEKKEMLSADAPRVIDVVADNRGLVQITLDMDLQSLTVNQNSVRFFEAGADGLLGTPDDVAVGNVDISYSFGDRTITADARLEAGTAYSVRLVGSLIRGTNGCLLDGEFNGSGLPSGDGVEGGDFEFFARQTGPTIARITTNFGVIDIELFPGDTPITVANFLRYANEGLYDRTIFHRSVDDFVIQGGGFEADVPFLPIPVFDPIQNEPGISNLRGTIAMAKMGGDPNSATSQFFFNLGDNSGNLDSQNGGFTVFGEALNEESLAIIDAIAALETFDASVTSPAFNEVPVEDLALIENTSGVLMERDVVRIDRVAQLLTVTAEPFGQIDTDEVRTIADGAGQARVTLFSLSGAPLGNLGDFVRVNFGGGARINSITFTGTPAGPIGLQISGASSVGQISERRGGADLQFIVSDARIDTIRLKSAISGFALNGVLLADNVLLPEDIDGDNSFQDDTAIYVMEGTTRQLRLDNGLSGDVIIPGGLVDLRVKGDTSMSDIRTGANENGVELNVRMDRVRDTVLDSDAPIRRLRADSWSPFATQSASVEAPSASNITIRGNFGADLSLTDPAAQGQTINVRGDVLRSTWNVAGDIRRIKLDFGGTWTFFAGGEVGVFRGGEMRNFTSVINGGVINFRVDELDGADVRTASAVRFVVARGDLIGNVVIGDEGPRSLRQFRVGGDLIDAAIGLSGDVNNFRIRGDITRSSINGQGDFGNLKFKVVTDTEFETTGAVRQLRAVSWEGGGFEASEARAIRTTGDRRSDDPGDFAADLVVSNARVVRIAGDLRDSDFRVGDNRDFRVGGDVIDSDIRMFRLFFFSTIAGVDVNIGGDMIGSRLLANASLRSIATDAMVDSAIYIGSTANPNRFASIGQIDPNARIDSIVVRGSNELTHSFENSYIVGGRIDYVRVTDPLYQNTDPFGIAGVRLDRVEVVSPELVRGYTSPDEGIVVIDDMQIRPGFQSPA